MSQQKNGQGYKILQIDPMLAPYEADIDLRMELLDRAKARLLGEKSLSEYANGHLYFGFHQAPDGWYYREWAPGAREIHLFGEFNGWNRESHSLRETGEGNWEIFLPGRDALSHGSRVKIEIATENERFDRIPPYCTRVVQDPHTKDFDGQIWQPPEPFAWTDADFAPHKDEPLLIYECHVGMAGERAEVSTYAQFAETVLPRIKWLGYNAIQLMAVMEHPYYGSFGYQVSNFFAASSRFGTPEELKRLIDTAHSLGIAVLLDIVHSHAAPNEMEGLARFDGTEYQFFHQGSRGRHSAWGSRLFDYGKGEVLHFLLSNIKFWLDEYHFDGLRFDGVTSMLYHDHGLGGVFDHYDKYFSRNTDTQAVTYLQLAAGLAKEVKPGCILIAEDMSGMPGMCLPIADGGFGFDYRLGMGMPDFWIKNLKEKRDEDWEMGALWHELNQRRPREKVVGYCESHDQALVGDKTIIFWLADKEMYWHMQKDDPNLRIDRAMSLHKMIRLITCACAGEGYLNFMGNEFGHPEWVDFPREGNGWSCHYARRQWSLADNPDLRYRYLQDFDRHMISLIKTHNLPGAFPRLLLYHEAGKVLAFQKGQHLFLFNFHPTDDFTATIPVEGGANWITALHTNWQVFGGHKSNVPALFFPRWDGRAFHLEIPLDRRCAIVCRQGAPEYE